MSRKIGLKLVIALAIVGIATITPLILQATISNNNKFDPYPVFSTLDPHIFLYMHERLLLKGIPSDKKHREWFGISITPFGQNATQFIDLNNNTIPLGDFRGAPFNNPDITPVIPPTPIVAGSWAMIPLVYGATPQGQVFPPLLLDARTALFPNVPVGVPIDDPVAIDPARQFGYFQIGGEYRKRGLRAEFQAQFLKDFGLDLQIGFADISFTALTYRNLTNLPTAAAFSTAAQAINPNLTQTNVNDFLMIRLDEIASQINFDICNFRQNSIEDIRAGLYWRHAYAMNQNRARGYSCDWPQFLLIPWAMVQGSAAVSSDVPKNKAWGIPFSNDGHNALGACAGLNLDFTETIEVGIEFGATHFFSRSFSCVPVPTNKYQSGIYPFTTNVCIQPGVNFHLGAKMFAYQFLDCLSCHFEYIVVMHRQDCITVNPFDPAFMPRILECRSNWTAHLANIGFNYDISPYISIGFLWQPPLADRNAAKSTTIMFSFNACY